MMHGLTLTDANTIIWWSPATSLEIYEQATARINRPGQMVKTEIAHLSGTAAERGVYVRLRKPRVNFRVCSWSCSRIKPWTCDLLTLEV
jgi:hypothetical protein